MGLRHRSDNAATNFTPLLFLVSVPSRPNIRRIEDSLAHEAGTTGMSVLFHGVRGSTPCHGPDIMRYGGNTSCVSIDIPGSDPILLDLGTGLRYFGATQPADKPFRGTCLLSHLHWDHIQGLPFFTPLLKTGALVTVYAPAQDDGTTVASVFASTIRPPLFPIDLAVLPGEIVFVDVANDDFVLNEGTDAEVRVKSRVIPHVGRTLGYRIEWGDYSVAYLSDHQQPCDGSLTATDGALELCRDVDLLIHDAQYTVNEFDMKCDWGHCTADYALWLAAESGAKQLALFHHDPSHHDDQLDLLVAAAKTVGESLGVEVFGAFEGLSVVLGG
ncbi:MAG: phosphoribosyl 1,2-cyclic phosphodiesterase [Candidatus Aldehydirespiratoraceae bacterium]|jgi:phosphoribosyl 1,2-cyclic phosphodiesterase